MISMFIIPITIAATHRMAVPFDANSEKHPDEKGAEIIS
jgi:hypothetical protein